MPENKNRFIDQMMAALAKKNQQKQQMDQHRDPVTGEIKSRPRRGTGPVSNKPQKRSAGRGR